MKALIWIIIGLILVGGIAWLLSTNDIESSDVLENIPTPADTLSEAGRVIDTDTAVFDEIDDALNAFE